MQPLQPAPEPRKRTFFAQISHIWYTLTAPPEVSPRADLAERRSVQRGRMASIFILTAIINTLPGFVFSLIMGTAFPKIMLSFLFALEFFAFYLNRRKHIKVVGLICVVALEAGLATTILTTGRLTADTLQILDMLILPLIYAASLLPTSSVFLVALLNCAFAFYVFNFLPNSAEIHQLIVLQGNVLFSRFVSVQIAVAVATFVWVRNVEHAVERADRADAVVLLERTLARKDRAESEQKQLLEKGINDVVHGIAVIARNPNDEIVIDIGKPLWQIVMALNNLRRRLVRLKYEAEEQARDTRQMKHAIAQLMYYLEQGPESLALWQPTGTPVDDVARRLTQDFLVYPKVPKEEKRSKILLE